MLRGFPPRCRQLLDVHPPWATCEQAGRIAGSNIGGRPAALRGGRGSHGLQGFRSRGGRCGLSEKEALGKGFNPARPSCGHIDCAINGGPDGPKDGGDRSTGRLLGAQPRDGRGRQKIDVLYACCGGGRSRRARLTGSRLCAPLRRRVGSDSHRRPGTAPQDRLIVIPRRRVDTRDPAQGGLNLCRDARLARRRVEKRWPKPFRS
jgi:hypothetical protein